MGHEATTSAGQLPVAKSVSAFYDEFAGHLLHDYLHGNRRVDAQRAFFLDAVPTSARRVLVAGCGIGDTAAWLKRRLPRGAQVRGIDISAENIRLAEALFAESGVSFGVADITVDELGGPWDVICFPDVYEHIPVDLRGRLHEKVHESVRPGSLVLLTVPSESHQRALMQAGQGLQVVDEIVTLDDLTVMARDVGGFVSFFGRISAYSQNDYLHAAIEVGDDIEDKSRAWIRSRLKRCAVPEDALGRLLNRAQGLRRRIERRLRRRHVRRVLGPEALKRAVRKI